MGALSLVGGIASAIGSSVNSKRAANEVKSQQGILNAQNAMNQGFFNKQYYQDMVARSDVSNMLRRLSEQMKTERNRDNATNAIMGATPDLQIAQESQRSKSYADSVANLASNAAAFKDNLMNNWQNNLNQYYNNQVGMSDKIANIWTNQSNQWSTASNNLFSSGANQLGTGIDKLVEA